MWGQVLLMVRFASFQVQTWTSIGLGRYRGNNRLLREEVAKRAPVRNSGILFANRTIAMSNEGVIFEIQAEPLCLNFLLGYAIIHFFRSWVEVQGHPGLAAGTAVSSVLPQSVTLLDSSSL